MFRIQTVFQKDVSPTSHNSEGRFAPISELGKTFRPLFIFTKDVSSPNHKTVCPVVLNTENNLIYTENHFFNTENHPTSTQKHTHM